MRLAAQAMTMNTIKSKNSNIETALNQSPKKCHKTAHKAAIKVIASRSAAVKFLILKSISHE
jgi:hypothetical protein